MALCSYFKQRHQPSYLIYSRKRKNKVRRMDSSLVYSSQGSPLIEGILFLLIQVKDISLELEFFEVFFEIEVETKDLVRTSNCVSYCFFFLLVVDFYSTSILTLLFVSKGLLLRTGIDI